MYRRYYQLYSYKKTGFDIRLISNSNGKTKSTIRNSSEKWSEEVFFIKDFKSTLLITTNLYVLDRVNSRMVECFFFKSTLGLLSYKFFNDCGRRYAYFEFYTNAER